MLSARALAGKTIGVKEDFVSAGERQELLDYVRSPHAAWDKNLPPNDVWYGRKIDPPAMPDNVRTLMADIRNRAIATIKADYEITDTVYADTLQLVRWRPGDQQAPHADCEEPDGRPNQFPWRAFASIIYLNEDFEGGQIHFPNLFYQPEIKAGMLTYFPSSAKYLHGVKPVTAGLRFTHSCFYTGNKFRGDGEAF